MELDAAIAAALLLYVGFGWWRGLFSQVVGFVAIGAAWVLSPLLAKPVEAVLFASHPAGAFAVKAASVLVAALLIVIAVYALVRALPEAVAERSKLLKAANRSAGAVFGAARGVASVYLLLCALAWVEPGLKPHAPRVTNVLQQSATMDIVRRNNLLRHFEVL